VFVELAEVYGKLNNDNKVIAALTQAVAHDPSQTVAYDRLAAIYEAKKRWPDLVKVLGEKAERAGSDADKVGIYLQIANLYLERFSNQAEAIKAFEKVLELDSQNQEATDHLLAVYEKRRDWEKLIKLKEAEVERTPRASAAPRSSPSRRWRRRRSRSPRSRPSGGRRSSSTTDPRGSAGRAVQALRAQQGVGQARRHLGAPGRRREGRQDPRGRAPAPRLALHGEGREQREGDRGVAALARPR